MANIAEILKDAPQGLELYSPLLGNVYVDKIINNGIYRIQITDTNKDMRWFMQDGRYINKLDDAECLLFPSKKHRTWDNWQEILFQKGDVITVSGGEILLFNCTDYAFTNKAESRVITKGIYRYATPEERDQFFKELNNNGYYWNENTKQMGKSLLTDSCSCVNAKTKERPFTIDDFKPFDKVLVRDNHNSMWEIELFMRYDTNIKYSCLTCAWRYCVPYNDETKHLLGTTDECPDKYKTW